MVFALRMLLLRQVRKANHRFGTKPPPAPVARWLPWIVEGAGRNRYIRRAVSRLIINSYAYATTSRPRAMSLAADYTTWQSLTDRSFSGRHLAPATPVEELPCADAVVELYLREEGKEIKATDTSVLFTIFAQWFTDSFLRASRSDLRKNSSTHNIDLCQIYGLSSGQTKMLRGDNGRLKSQLLGPDGKREEYPPYLFEKDSRGELVIKPKFNGLYKERAFAPFRDRYPEKCRDQMFAVGLEYGNSTIGHTILNTTFLREHNRIAQMLEEAYPEWDDDDGDRIFETTRNILIVVLLKIVVKEYIKHIAPTEFPIEAVPFIADGERWNRTNWMSIEFDLLYRWHSLVPDRVGSLVQTDLLNNNSLVLTQGIDSLVAQLSSERAGKIGLQNTPELLIKMAEAPTVKLMRSAHLQSFNEYRKAFDLKPLTSFDQLTKDSDLQRRLEELYGHIDKLEWYVGIFAEDYPEQRMMGDLMTTMVAYDAFTQAFTNPLLSRNVYNERTFSKVGLDIIAETHSLQDIFARNSKSPDQVFASFRCSPADSAPLTEGSHNAHQPAVLTGATRDVV